MVVTRIAARVCMMALFVTAFAPGPALAQADDANKILKAMSDYLGSQKNFSASFEVPRIAIGMLAVDGGSFAIKGYFDVGVSANAAPVELVRTAYL